MFCSNCETKFCFHCRSSSQMKTSVSVDMDTSVNVSRDFDNTPSLLHDTQHISRTLNYHRGSRRTSVYFYMTKSSLSLCAETFDSDGLIDRVETVSCRI